MSAGETAVSAGEALGRSETGNRRECRSFWERSECRLKSQGAGSDALVLRRRPIRRRGAGNCAPFSGAELEYQHVRQRVYAAQSDFGGFVGDGNPVSGDAAVALKKIRNGTAALTTLGGIGEALGGYKGYGYAMVVELLSAVLQDGNYGKALDGKGPNGEKVPYHLGHFFIAIDTNHFLGEELCRKKAGEIIRSVRNSKKAPGAERIYTAGEKEHLVRLARKDGVPINESVQKEICEVRDELGLTQYKFPWED